MYRICKRRVLSERTFEIAVEAPDVARAARPGHFVMLRIDREGERIPLTIADYDQVAGTVTMVVQAVGKTTYALMRMMEGESVLDFIGPLGLPSVIEPVERVVLVGGGLGVAAIFPQMCGYRECGARTTAIVGFRDKASMFWEERFKKHADRVIVTTDDVSYGEPGPVTRALARLVKTESIDRVIAVGPIAMMRAVCDETRAHKIPTVVSLNAIMVDGTGMCGSCRVTVGGEVRFACVDGPEFDGHAVDFDEMRLRAGRFRREERECMERFSRERDAMRLAGPTGMDPASPPTMSRGGLASQLKQSSPPSPAEARPIKLLKNLPPKKVPMRTLDPETRRRTFDEVSLGYSLDEALVEADRCLYCKKARCVQACPVHIDIPGFIKALSRRQFDRSYSILRASSSLPAVCGRVCPQETQCEAACIIGTKLEPVAIGRLERFVADAAQASGCAGQVVPSPLVEAPSLRAPRPVQVAVVGSGPAGVACAADLAQAGVKVTIYEALHTAGGVLRYGIPEFRLPNEIIDAELSNLRRLGVTIEVDQVIGKVFGVRDLIEQRGYDAVFLATGAGSPKFMGIPGESLNGVFSANEFLTRVNLMRGFMQPLYDTPVGMGRRVAVIGAGNTAMDAARVAMRMNAESVCVVYRRSRQQSPARREELEHAIEEGIRFHWLTQPTAIRQGRRDWAGGLSCVRTELGRPDASGRRQPVVQPGSEFTLDVDTVVYALGTRTNPIIQQSMPDLHLSARGHIEVDETTMMSNVAGVFAGGDVVTGSATVIMAMGAGKQAAQGILKYLNHTIHNTG